MMDYSSYLESTTARVEKTNNGDAAVPDSFSLRRAFPDLEFAVASSGEQSLADRGEGDDVDALLVGAQVERDFAAVDVPDGDGPILSGRGEASAVGMERQVVDHARVPAEGQGFFGSGHVPDLDREVL